MNSFEVQFHFCIESTDLDGLKYFVCGILDACEHPFHPVCKVTGESGRTGAGVNSAYA